MASDVERLVAFCKKDNLEKLEHELSKGPTPDGPVSLFFSDPRNLDS